MHAQIHINQSRIDDITLKEDLIPEATDMPFGAEFGVIVMLISLLMC